MEVFSWRGVVLMCVFVVCFVCLYTLILDIQCTHDYSNTVYVRAGVQRFGGASASVCF